MRLRAIVGVRGAIALRFLDLVWPEAVLLVFEGMRSTAARAAGSVIVEKAEFEALKAQLARDDHELRAAHRRAFPSSPTADLTLRRVVADLQLVGVLEGEERS